MSRFRTSQLENVILKETMTDQQLCFAPNKFRRILVLEETSFYAEYVTAQYRCKWKKWSTGDRSSAELRDVLKEQRKNHTCAGLFFDHNFPALSDVVWEDLAASPTNMILVFSCSRITDVPEFFHRYNIDCIVLTPTTERTDLTVLEQEDEHKARMTQNFQHIVNLKKPSMVVSSNFSSPHFCQILEPQSYL